MRLLYHPAAYAARLTVLCCLVAGKAWDENNKNMLVLGDVRSLRPGVEEEDDDEEEEDDDDSRQPLTRREIVSRQGIR